MTELSPTTETYRINPTIYRGRPENPQGRLPKELAAYDLLDSLGIPYERLDHDPLPTIEACQEVDRIFGLDICKNLFLRNAQKTSFYLLMMPGSKKFRTAALSKPAFFCRAGIYGTIFGPYPRIGQRPGPYE